MPLTPLKSDFFSLWCEVFISAASLQLPTIIADNAGYDSADLVAQLRAAHQENRTTFGLSELGQRATTHVHRGAA